MTYLSCRYQSRSQIYCYKKNFNKMKNIITITLTLISTVLFSDLIILKNGEVFDGEVISYNEGNIRIKKSDGSILSGDISAVKSINFKKGAILTGESETPPLKNYKVEHKPNQGELIANVVFAELKAMEKTMTSVQYDLYVKSFKGKLISGNGIIENVSRNRPGTKGYGCLIKTEDGSISAEIPESLALILEKGRSVKFKGNITYILGSFSISIDKPEISYD